MSTKSMGGMMEGQPSAMQASKETFESALSLRLLSSIENDKSVTQRSLALRLGIALGHLFVLIGNLSTSPIYKT